MKTVKLKKLRLKNFKGISYFIGEFKDGINYVIGDNKAGKTTLVNAYLWLLTGKDINDKQDFNIKTYDSSGNIIHNMEHEVTGFFDIDGQPVELRRVFKEVWRKNRTNGQRELVSNTTVYEIDSVPKKTAEYDRFISETICDGTVFKMVSNPLYFPSLHWEDQRKILFDIIGNISEVEIASNDQKYKFISDDIKRKGIEGFKKQLRSEISKMRQDVEVKIPERIDELLRDRPDPVDVKKVSARIKALENEIEELEETLRSEISKKEKEGAYLLDMQSKINDLENEVEKLRNAQRVAKERSVGDLKVKIQTLKNELELLTSTISNREAYITQLTNDKASKEDTLKKNEEEREKLLAEWNEEYKKELVLKEDDITCPTCKRPYDIAKASEIENEMTENFNKAKAAKLEKIKAAGLKLKEASTRLTEEVNKIPALIKEAIEEVEALKGKVEEYKKEIANVEKEIDQRETTENVEDTPQIKAIKKEIETLKEEMKAKVTTDKKTDDKEIRAQISEKKGLIKDLQAELNKAELLDKAIKRQKELEKELQEKQGLIADREKALDAIGEIVERRVKLLEERVNELFTIVKFRLFKRQVNGDIVETCEAMVDGVPFSTLNTASQINAGFDILNVISEHYKVQVPIFVDNRESVSAIIDSKGRQEIHLYKVTGEKLKIVDFTPELVLSNNLK